MTPEQKKAKELVETFRQALILNVPLIIDWLKDESEWLETAKQCALNCVDEIIAVLQRKVDYFTNRFLVKSASDLQSEITHYQQVKTEIQKL